MLVPVLISTQLRTVGYTVRKLSEEPCYERPSSGGRSLSCRPTFRFCLTLFLAILRFRIPGLDPADQSAVFPSPCKNESIPLRNRSERRNTSHSSTGAPRAPQRI